jgi:hypothetical protein
MRQLASAEEPAPVVGDLVVIDGAAGVFRVESFVTGQVRCFSYVDGRFLVVDAAVVRRCPPGTRAAP